jgi:TetR/AcrR family transcriptional repressor of uid operon
LLAAREVFSERGYEAATFQEIAVRADLTRPAINHYFTNKRVLYLEVVAQTNELVVAAAIERAQRESTLLGRLSEFVAATIEADAQNRSAAAFLITAVWESKRHPELSGVENDSLGATRAFLSRVLDEAIQRGELTSDADIASLTEMLVAVLCGVGFYAGFVGDRQALKAITALLGRLMAGQLWQLRN